MEVVLIVIGLPILIGVLLGIASGTSEQEKYYRYKNREFEEENHDKKIR